MQRERIHWLRRIILHLWLFYVTSIFHFYLSTLFTTHKYVMRCKRWVSWQIYRSKFRDIASYLHVLVLWCQRFTLVYVSPRRHDTFLTVWPRSFSRHTNVWFIYAPEREGCWLYSNPIQPRCISYVRCPSCACYTCSVIRFSAYKLVVMDYSCIVVYLLYNWKLIHFRE